MDHCLLNPEYLNIEQNPAISHLLSTFLVFDCMGFEIFELFLMWFQSSLSIHVADLCLTNQVHTHLIYSLE